VRRAVLLSVTLIACGGGGDDPLPPVTDPIPYADPTIGSGGFGFAYGSAFPGAAAPHGLAKVGPDTSGEFGTLGFQHFSGYFYDDDTIQGFSHVHLHGTGATDYGVLTFMPTDAPVTATAQTLPAGYQSTFAKETEVATPGYYAATLDRGGIVAEMTATAHAAHHRYTGAPHVILDLAKHLSGGEIPDAELTLIPAERRITGRLRHIGGMSGGFGGYDLWFDAVTLQDWTGQVVWSDALGAPQDGTAASGTGVGAALSFAAGAPVELQVGISLVSADGARANRETELGDRDFDATRAATEEAWRDLLSAVLVEGGTEAQRRIFYSSLYRAFLMPTAIGDADGTFRFGAGEPQAADGYRFLSDMSLWDTYRTLHPLYDLLYPESARDSVRSLHAMAQAHGCFPKWPIATGESGTMVGASAEVVLADAYVKGVTDFDAAGAYALLRAAAFDVTDPPGGRCGRGDIGEYLDLAYVPASRNRSASITVEYAWNDHALGQLAAALGEEADAALLADRAQGWRSLYDADVGFVRARNADGTWPPVLGGYDPVDFLDDYVEANGWQTLFSALHDVPGVIELLGGEAAVIARLEELFAESADDLIARPLAEVSSNAQPRPYYWHGNEPDIHVPYVFALAGRPDLAAQWVAWVRDELYNDGGAGLAGNDDGGTLSSWYVFTALGFYPIAGTDRYILNTPLFPRATVRLPGGTTLVIERTAAPDNAATISLDGTPVTGPELRHADLTAASTLLFE
jgi:predicted alpha-1,2-mannosidase